MVTLQQLLDDLNKATTLKETLIAFNAIMKQDEIEKKQQQRQAFINKQINETILSLMADSKVEVAVFAHEVISETDTEVQRLLVDLLDGKEKLNEAITAVEYQRHFDVTLERPQPQYNEDGTPKAGFDYWITNTGKRLDFMFTMHGYSDDKIGKLNRFFAHNEETLRDKKDGIKEHLEKADIVPIDLRFLINENRLILINYVLSLSEKEQQQIVFILGG